MTAFVAEYGMKVEKEYAITGTSPPSTPGSNAFRPGPFRWNLAADRPCDAAAGSVVGQWKRPAGEKGQKNGQWTGWQTAIPAGKWVQMSAWIKFVATVPRAGGNFGFKIQGQLINDWVATCEADRWCLVSAVTKSNPGGDGNHNLLIFDTVPGPQTVLVAGVTMRVYGSDPRAGQEAKGVIRSDDAKQKGGSSKAPAPGSTDEWIESAFGLFPGYAWPDSKRTALSAALQEEEFFTSASVAVMEEDVVVIIIKAAGLKAGTSQDFRSALGALKQGGGVPKEGEKPPSYEEAAAMAGAGASMKLRVQTVLGKSVIIAAAPGDTVLSVLSVVAKAGLVDEGKTYGLMLGKVVLELGSTMADNGVADGAELIVTPSTMGSI